MKRTQDKTTGCLTAVLSLAVVLTASSAMAQSLPTNPWAAAQQTVQQAQPSAPVGGVQTGATSATVVYVQQVGPVVYGSQPYQPTYEGGDSNIWNTKMPQFTGEMTTWGEDHGQRVTAPEVNIHNILAISDHLRNMGYQIPDTFGDRVKAAPEAARKRIFKAMNDLKRQDDPFSEGARKALKIFENETGLSYENLIGNSLKLLSSK